MLNLWGGLRYAVRQFRLSPVFTGAAGAHARAGHRRHHRDLHADPRGDAALAAGRRPGRPVPHRRRRQLLRPGRPSGPLGHVFLSALRALEGRAPEFEAVAAFQAGGARLSVRREGVDTAAGRCARSSSPATTSRRLASARFGGRVLSQTTTRPSAPPVAVLSHHAWQAALRRRPSGRRLDVRDRRASVHGHRRRAAGILRRDASRRSARPVDSAAAGAADRRRRRAAASAGVGVAARDRPVAAGRVDRRHGAAADRHPAAVDAARLRLSGELDARRHPRCFRSRRSPSCPPAPASA